SGSSSILASPRARIAGSIFLRSQKPCQNCFTSSALMSSARRPGGGFAMSAPNEPEGGREADRQHGRKAHDGRHAPPLGDVEHRLAVELLGPVMHGLTDQQVLEHD